MDKRCLPCAAFVCPVEAHHKRKNHLVLQIGPVRIGLLKRMDGLNEDERHFLKQSIYSKIHGFHGICVNFTEEQG
jgi:hypothetical protein